MKQSFFGTDGIRGAYGSEYINDSFAYSLGESVAQWLSTKEETSHVVVVGRDTRLSGENLSHALIAGLDAGGVKVENLGVVPTPLLARSLLSPRYSLGIMITASHNPASDNGFKCLGVGGKKLSTQDEVSLSETLKTFLKEKKSSVASEPTKTASSYVADLKKEYFLSLKSIIPSGLKGWKICVDTANGASCETTPEVLKQLGAEVIARGNTPTGLNINLDCGSEYPKHVMRDVVANQAQLGIAHDGDGDRCILCDENGEQLNGDEILAILGTDLLSRGELLSKTLIATVHSNLGLDQAIKNAGGEVVRTPVGDRHVSEAMKRLGSNLGGESSGHIITPRISPTGDGASAALHVISVMQRTGKKLSELRKVMERYPQAYIAFSVKEKKPIQELRYLQQKIAEVEASLAGKGIVLVRYSGTEMKLRLMVQAHDLKTAEGSLSQLVEAAKKDLN